MISPDSTIEPTKIPSTVPQSAFADDDVLRHVHQTARQVTGIGRLQRRIRQTFACAVRRDEVLQHVQTFAEVRRDRRFDNFTRRLRHQTAHTGQLTDLLFRSAGAGVGHEQDRIESVARLLGSFHFVEHHVGDLFRHVRPDGDDLVVTFAVRDRAVTILLIDLHDFVLSVVDKLASCPEER